MVRDGQVRVGMADGVYRGRDPVVHHECAAVGADDPVDRVVDVVVRDQGVAAQPSDVRQVDTRRDRLDLAALDPAAVEVSGRPDADGDRVRVARGTGCRSGESD